MRRKSFNVAATALLLCCVAGWIASSHYVISLGHLFELPTPAADGDFIASRFFRASAAGGVLSFDYDGEVGMAWHRPDSDEPRIVERDVNPWSQSRGFHMETIPAAERVPWTECFGGHWCWFGPRRMRHQGDLLAVGIPLWVPTALLAVVVLFRFPRSSRPNGCTSCGYNLTANVSGICPECGTPVPKEPADKSPQRA